MTENIQQTSSSGRANAVLLPGDGKDSKAVVSSVVARIRAQQRGKRIRFIGPVKFAPKTLKHIKEVVLPATDNIIDALGLPEYGFDISVVNLGATSLNKIGITISGYSADVPVLLAILSANLDLPISDDIVCTGHIASPDGDIRMVKGLQAKLRAAEKTESIHTFVYPDMDNDKSLEHFTPVEKEAITDALFKAKNVIRTVSVQDIGDLVRAVFSEDQVILASLKKGFFKNFPSIASIESSVGKAIRFFTKDDEERFWKILEYQMIAGRSDDAKQLLLAFC